MSEDYKTALITGASSGLGRALAVWFARRGVRVYAAARRAEHLQALRDEVAATGGVVEPVTLDVADTGATVERIRALDRESGGLGLVIANAGIGEQTPAWRMDWPKVERTLQVNVMGAAATLTAALPGMVERNRGQVVGISSIAAFRGMPQAAAYSGSKAFLTTFLQSLRVDLSGTGVAVTAIHPGYVKTEMTAKNKSMVLVLEADEAAERMGRAIVRRVGEFSFPTPMAMVGRIVSMVPDGLVGLAANAGKRKKKQTRRE
jgi:short-subunit dehydrogenase